MPPEVAEVFHSARSDVYPTLPRQIGASSLGTLTEVAPPTRSAKRNECKPPFDKSCKVLASRSVCQSMKTAKNIVHVVPSVSEESSGPTYVVTRLCESLVATGLSVTLGSLDLEPSVPVLPYGQLFPLGLGPRRLGRSPAMWHWLRDIVASGSATIVHNHGMWQMNAVYPGWACRGRRFVKLVVSPHGSFSRWAFSSGSRVKRLFWPLLQRPALAGAACFHATAEAEHLDIRRLGFLQPVAMIPFGIDIPEPCTKTEDGPRTLMFLGRLHRVKGLDLLLRAWAAVQDRFPDWRLQIVGSDLGYHGSSGYGQELRDLAAGLKLLRVEFVGELRGLEKLRAYREAQLFILPSRTENFGVVVAEALAAGTPVLASKAAPWQGLELNRCGWWVDLDADSLASALASAMAMSPSALAKMGERGRDWMVRDFAWPRIGRMMAETYAWLSEGGAAPAFVRFD